MQKFVIWGLGVRGKRLINFLSSNQIAAIIESNSELLGTEYKSIPIIDFETYCNKYTEFYIIITPMFCEEILNLLKNRFVFRFFLLSECQAELQYGGYEFPITEYPIVIQPHDNYIIYGLTLWGVLLYQFLRENKCGKVNILPHPCADKRIVNDLTGKINMITSKDYKVTCDRLLIAVEDQEKTYTDVLIGKFVVENMFDLSDSFEVYRNKEIEKYKNIHSGERCFIIGNGPSLLMCDLDRLWHNKEICFGCNRIYLTQSDTRWRPDYYIAEDRKFLMTCKKEILEYDCSLKFIGDTYPPFWTHDMTVQSINKYHCHAEICKDCKNGFCRMPKFSYDFSKKSYASYTVTYSCLQLAVYMGFKQIYLLGVDCNYKSNTDHTFNSSNQNHFSKDYESGLENQKLRADTDGMILAYKSAKQYADEHGIKIYNATRGGKLEVFERVDFDSLF